MDEPQSALGGRVTGSVGSTGAWLRFTRRDQPNSFAPMMSVDFKADHAGTRMSVGDEEAIVTFLSDTIDAARKNRPIASIDRRSPHAVAWPVYALSCSRRSMARFNAGPNSRMATDPVSAIAVCMIQKAVAPIAS